MVGVAARVEDLHGDLGALVLVHRLGHVPMDAHLVGGGGWVCGGVIDAFIVCINKGGARQKNTSSELVSLAAKGDSFPCRFGAMPPVTMSPTPFLALCSFNLFYLIDVHVCIMWDQTKGQQVGRAGWTHTLVKTSVDIPRTAPRRRPPACAGPRR